MNNLTDHGKLIYAVCKLIKPKSYLELGIYDGETIEFLKETIPFRVGVDIKKNRNDFTFEFFQGTTKEFFENNKRTFDFIFIDANHNYDYVKYDLEEAKKILNYNGVIVLHDTDPESAHLLQEGYCSDSYKILKYINSTSDLTQITFPVAEAGVTFVKLKNHGRIQSILNEK